MPIGWHRGLFLQKTRAVKNIFFVLFWVLYKVTYRTSQSAPKPLPKSAKHDSTVVLPKQTSQNLPITTVRWPSEHPLGRPVSW